jgi:hypothetical protein
MLTTILAITIMVILGSAVILMGGKIDRQNAENRRLNNEVDTLTSAVTRQSQMVFDYEAEISTLKSQLTNDANGHVKRGKGGRFVSAKG